MAARSLLSLALLAGLLVPVAGTGAQEYTDSTSVLVVEVPVQVVRDGAPVVGLTADNFEIVDEGQKQVVTGFDVLDLREPQTQQKLQNMGAAARRHFVFVFDLSFSQPNAIVRARQAAYDVVRGNLHPSDLIGVATYSNRGGPQLILNFTTDRRQVEQAFTTLGLLQEGRMIDDPLGIVVRESELSGELGRDPASAGGGDDSATGVSADAEMREAIERIAGESSQADLRRQVGIFASTFGFLADLLAPLEGRKHVVFLSEGFDASSLFGTADAERMAEIQEAVEFGEFWKVDNDERFGDSQTLSEMNDVLGRFRKADAAIHAIDIGRLSADGAGTPTARARQDGLFMLSNETGGDFYRNYSDLSEAMSEMLERTSVTYVLAFQPDLQRGRSGYRRLRVKLKDVPRGTKASYREGYFTPSSFSELSESQQKLLSAQQMMSGGPPTGVQGLTASVLATPFSSTASKAFVPVLLQVPAHEISRVPLGEELHLEVYAYAMDAEGTVHDHFAESVRFDMNELGDKILTTGVKYFGHLDLDPGEYALRVMVVDRRNGSTSVEVTPLVVPDFAEAGLAVLPPLFPEETEQWVLVRETEDGTEQSSRAYPFLFKGQPYVPAVLPVFEVEQVVAVSLVAAKGRSGYLEVDGLVLAEDGTPIPGTFVRVLEREWDESAGVERMIAAFEVPNLPAGKYSLVVTMSDLGSGEVESGTLEFGLGRSADRGAIFNPPLWMPALDEVVDRLGPEDTGRKVVKIDREQLRSSYEEVLRQLAAGRMGGAVQALTELEGALINKKDPMATLAQVVKVERSVLDEVTQRDPDLLLPAILLHKESYSQYRLRKEPYLAVHAKTTTQELIDLYAKRSQSSQAAKLGSRILANMAAEVYSSGAHISAKAMFSRAIALDPTNGVALLGLGFMFENMGYGDLRIPNYEDAVEVLQQAVAVDPGLHEARLRLAINLQRLDRGLDAAQQLQLVIDSDDASDWVLSLAYQEFARIYVAREAYDQARKVLERGVERLPEESKLSLQLAYVYERSQRQYQAGEAAKEATGDGLSARFLYLQVPRQLEQGEGGWVEAATERLPALATALGSGDRVGS